MIDGTVRRYQEKCNVQYKEKKNRSRPTNSYGKETDPEAMNKTTIKYIPLRPRNKYVGCILWIWSPREAGKFFRFTVTLLYPE